MREGSAELSFASDPEDRGLGRGFCSCAAEDATPASRGDWIALGRGELFVASGAGRTSPTAPLGLAPALGDAPEPTGGDAAVPAKPAGGNGAKLSLMETAGGAMDVVATSGTSSSQARSTSSFFGADETGEGLNGAVDGFSPIGIQYPPHRAGCKSWSRHRWGSPQVRDSWGKSRPIVRKDCEEERGVVAIKERSTDTAPQYRATCRAPEPATLPLPSTAHSISRTMAQSRDLGSKWHRTPKERAEQAESRLDNTTHSDAYDC